MPELTGWLLDLFDEPGGGIVLWVLGEDGQRHRLHQDFPVSFHAAGPAPRLRQLWQHLQAQPVPVVLSRQERCDLFQPEPVTVLSIQVLHPADQTPLFLRLAAVDDLPVDKVGALRMHDDRAAPRCGGGGFRLDVIFYSIFSKQKIPRICDRKEENDIAPEVDLP